MTERRINKIWDDKKKVEVVTTYLAVGKYSLVEAVTGVPKATIKAWKKSPWWVDLVHEIQAESDQQLDTKLQKIVDKSLDVVLDRIEHGDFVLNSKTGEITRIPSKLKDVHRVSVDLIDKRDLLRNRERVHVEVQAVDDYLKKLAAQFSEFVRKKLPKTFEGEVVEAVPLGFIIKEEANGELKAHAIHEEREEGLQTRGGALHEQTERNQEEGSTERSPQRDGSEVGA